ncbi:MAG: sialidase, partial [Verrucomicrobiota bacterium]|nr:sialidase [Verrucomicrobiota bacterium]
KWYDNTGWHAYENLGGILTSPPASVSWNSVKIDVFARGTDNGLLHRWFDSPNWSAVWENLGGGLSGGPGVSSWGVGRLDVFIRGTDNALYTRFYVTPSWSSVWASLGAIP